MQPAASLRWRMARLEDRGRTEQIPRRDVQMDVRQDAQSPGMAKTDPSEATRDTQRLEAFSDGVFAIAITLPIVELELPRLDQGANALARSLAELWPSYLGYGLSFVVIGIYWLRHHFSGLLYKRANHGFSLVNLLFLMTICFLPFPTRLFTESLLHTESERITAIFYSGALAAPAIAWMLKWLYGRGHGMIDEALDAVYLRRLTRRYILTAGTFTLAFALTFVDYRIGLGLSLAMTSLYLRPPPPPVFDRAQGAVKRAKADPG